MLSYQVLDRIADAHNPLLGVLWIAASLAPLPARHWRLAAARAGLGLGGLLVAYGLMWLDGAAQLWARAGWDYSTHTAVAVALVVTLACISRVAGIIAGIMFGLYVPLMLYQGYHSVADIGSTTLAVGMPLILLGRWAIGNVRAGRKVASTVQAKPLSDAV